MKEATVTYPTAQHDLADHIELLHKLDEARTKSRLWMDEGIKVLVDHKQEILKSARKAMDYSLAIRALETRLNRPFEKEDEQKDLLFEIFELGNGLQKLALEDIYNNNDAPILTAARILQALVACPGATFSTTALVCYYLIIRELYTSAGIDWNIGGVPAGRSGRVTAFVTGECVRALLSFADAQKKTGDFISKICEYKKKREKIEKLKNEPDFQGWIDNWVNTDKERLYLSYSLTLQHLSRNFVLPINLFDSKEFASNIIDYIIFSTSKGEPENLRKRLDSLADDLANNLRNNLKSKSVVAKRGSNGIFLEAIKQIRKFRIKEKKEGAINKDKSYAILRSETGHKIALSAIEDAWSQVQQANKYFENENDDTNLFVYCQERLNEAADNVRYLLAPVKNYLGTVLDRELATAFLEEPWDWQPSELACAATAYGSLKYLSDEWEKDARFSRAADQLCKSISHCGRIPNNLPYHVKFHGPSSYRYYDHFYISNFSALTSLAMLLRNVTEVTIESDLIEKILRFFEETRATRPLENGKIKGWCREEHLPIPRETELKSTAHAVFALAKINEMLDVRINHTVLHHFKVKTKNKTLKDDLTLDSVFYSDYGLKLAPDGDELKKKSIRPDWIEEKDWPANGIQREKSVAIILQQMHAHVSHINLPNRYKPQCSLVLHGPAGTGKTTLVEALAMTCEVPLVEVTPSDLIKHGGENIEKRARAVFDALSLLTRVVILFDEFDPVLKRRDPTNNNPQNVFSFLTPGMLPKLKDLHDRAEKHSVAYVLVTNLIGELDDAAVQKGRFDERLGIYPPDLLSRVGRFLDQIYSDFVDEKSKKFEPKSLPWDCIARIIKKTEGKGMTTLGKPGWFTRPKEGKVPEKDTPFGYVKSKAEPDEWPEPDDVFKNIILGKGKAAVTEYLQWQWIDKWDKKLFKDAATFKELTNPLKPDFPKGYSQIKLQEPERMKYD
jgi:hypothetical protein